MICVRQYGPLVENDGALPPLLTPKMFELSKIGAAEPVHEYCVPDTAGAEPARTKTHATNAATSALVTRLPRGGPLPRRITHNPLAQDHALSRPGTTSQQPMSTARFEHRSAILPQRSTTTATSSRRTTQR